MTVPAPQQSSWTPKSLKRVERTYSTSMGTAEVITDVGRAYIKVMGNKEGPHPLAAEWVGTHLAEWFGLPTFDVALLQLEESDCFPLPINHRARPGPAFASRAVQGHPWDGTETELDKLINPEAITRLVIFDNWVLNCDRYPPDLTVRKPNFGNVFLSEAEQAGTLQLIAMDHTHCFNCGREWTARLANIDYIQDSRLYGLFPAFAQYLRRDEATAAIARLRDATSSVVTSFTSTIPREWEVTPAARAALEELISRRALFVADRILQELPFGST